MPQVQRETFSFDPQEHPALAAWLGQWPRGARSRAIVDALEQYIKTPDHVTMLAILQTISEKLDNLTNQTTPSANQGEDTGDLLDIMDDRFA